MDDVISYLAYAAALGLAVHGAYLGKCIQTCLAIGTGLEGSVGPTGFQDAVTPPEVQRNLTLNWLTSIALFVGVWWVAGVTALAVVVGVRVVGRVFAGTAFSGPSTERRLVRKVFVSMCRRHADYIKTGDVIRADVMHDLITRFNRSKFARVLSA